MKKVMALMLIMAMGVGLFLVGGVGATSSKPDVTFVIDGQTFKTPAGEPDPYVNNDQRTMVSIRFFANAIGMAGKDVKWSNKTQTATLLRDGNEATITVGNPIMKVNGTSITMDTKAEMKNGRLFIPVRFAAIALGVYFEWDGDRKVITINSKEEVEPIPAFKYVLPGDEVFDNPKIDRMISFFWAKPVGGKFLFRADEFSQAEDAVNYSLKTEINPKINEQIYNATKVLLDENHFVHTAFYEGDPEGSTGSIAVVSFYRNELFARNGQSYFSYSFSEDKVFNLADSWNYSGFSKEVSIVLEVNRLWQDAKDGWVVPFYEQKLRASLMAIFGEKNGEGITDYVVSEYLKDHTDIGYDAKIIRDTKKFGDIKLDYRGTPDNDSPNFYFTIGR